MTTNKRGPYNTYAGQPAAKKRVRQVTLDEHSADVLTAFGDGNLSLGVRMAAAFIDQWRSVNGNFPFPLCAD